MKVVILGCSRVGALVASQLVSKGDEVSVIDQDPGSFKRLDKEFTGKTISGIGIDEEALIKAGIEQADAFIAVTNDDNTNLMAVQLVREKYKISRILLRVYGSKRAQTFKELGLNIICPTIDSAKKIEEFLSDKA
ncbi:MAG: TrkA family potassium uptake protein [candidate division Zixibacteria bacterium]|nr:TrkA family potassium uptake protein [candidate division Zixibacteria bacterium]